MFELALVRDFHLDFFPCQRIDTFCLLSAGRTFSLPVPCLQKGRPWEHLLFLPVKKELLSLDLFDAKNSSKSGDKSAVAIVENVFLYFNSYCCSSSTIGVGLFIGDEEEQDLIQNLATES